MQRSIQLGCVNPYLTCSVCTGYLLDATTIVECLHSFCRSCILRHLEISYNCPKCNTEIHKTKPLEYIRSDPCLQEIVYKLVPDLYSKEETRKNHWQKTNSNPVIDEPGPSAVISEDISDDPEDVRILVTLKYFRGTSRMERIKTENVLQMFPTRYLCCQPEMPVRVLKKFVQYKFDISPDIFQLELWRGDETLLDELTLKQLVQMYGLFRDRKPLELHYSFYPKFEPTQKQMPSIPSTPMQPPPPQGADSNTDPDTKSKDEEMDMSKDVHDENKQNNETSDGISRDTEQGSPNLENRTPDEVDNTKISPNTKDTVDGKDNSTGMANPLVAVAQTSSQDNMEHLIDDNNANNEHANTIDKQHDESEATMDET